jgi:nucleoside-diphosphate-sugar epimerase
MLPAMRVLIAGCGYVGLQLGAELAAVGHEVFGLRRSPEGAAAVAAAGLQPLIADLARLDSLRALPAQWDWVVQCAAAGGGEVPDYERVYCEGTRNLLDWLADTPPRKLVYTGSTGVYGQNDGGWVDETMPAEPLNPTGNVLRAAEELLLTAARERGFPALPLRVAGIYGPGRGYFFRQFIKGEARLEGDGRRHLNLVHRDDVAGAVLAALEHGQPARLYNVVDNEPVPQIELFAWLADALGQPMPPTAAMDPHRQRRRTATDKRISNRRLREELGYRLRFPTFREGYAAEVARVLAAGEPALKPTDQTRRLSE